eukprot:jgi/Botrbrau1/13387/Bobra.0194s0018.1
MLCLPIALMAASNARAEDQPLFPVLSPIPITIPEGPEPDQEANTDAHTLGSHPAAPSADISTVSTELPIEQQPSGKARKTLKPQKLSETTSSMLTFSNSAETAAKLPNKPARPWPNPHNASAKAVVCGSDFRWSAGRVVIIPVCRIYMYTNKGGTQYDIYTGWFVDPTHVATTGSAVAAGGSRKYSLFAVNGRYGTVCCAPTGNTPLDCPAVSSYNIIQAVTTSGWFNKGQISNAGAVLKVVGPKFTATLYPTATIACPTSNQVYLGQYQSLVLQPSSPSSSLCNDATIYPANSRQAFSSAFRPPADMCSTVLTSPSWAFPGGVCDGTLGTPFLGQDRTIVGLLTYASDTCSVGNTGTVGFSAISPGNTAWGVAIATLAAAIP